MIALDITDYICLTGTFYKNHVPGIYDAYLGFVPMLHALGFHYGERRIHPGRFLDGYVPADKDRDEDRQDYYEVTGVLLHGKDECFFR